MDFQQFFQTNPKYVKILQSLNEIVDNNVSQNTACLNIAENIKKQITTIVFNQRQKTIVYVCSNIYYATKAYESFVELEGTDNVSFFPCEEFVATDILASSNNFRLARMQTIARCIANVPQIIVTNTEGITRNIQSISRIKKSIINLSINDIYGYDNLINYLITNGYKRMTLTEVSGTFSIRGSIIDVFPINQLHPIRISFFDDTIESIKEFDPNTQMSIQKIKEIKLYPAYELCYQDFEVDDIIERITKEQKDSDKLKNNLKNIRMHHNLDQLYIYLPYIDPNYTNVLHLMNPELIIFDEYQRINEKEQQNIFEISEYLEKVEFQLPYNFLRSIEDISSLINNRLYFSEFQTKPNVKINTIIDFETNNNFDYNNNWRNFINDLKMNQNKTYIIGLIDDDKLSFVEQLLINNQIQYRKNTCFDEIKKSTINLIISNILGFNDYSLNLNVVTMNEISGHKVIKTQRFQKMYQEATPIYSKDELNVGDYVVHQDYGIGKYLGITSKKLQDVINDYLLIQYADDNKLYVPVENIYVLEKYLGNRDRIPKLNRLGTKEWTKKKERIKEKLEEIAKKLIETEAKRALIKGYIYNEDTPEQKQFEEDFEYLETSGQTKAIEEIKHDMESEKTLDRVLCGDVGYGKTEVAMRAAFKAVDNNKQVAYLAPTTVLARQHFHTFKERFEKYGIRVELLSRFVDKKTQAITIDGLKNGYVDIVIGTHRLLSKDVVFKDLSLLIIDEEHRFGVEHKERIKEIKANIDVLSLSATPIPRTLQMALTGVKDLSIIETPPVNRFSVQTYVLEHNDSIVREAINRELAREGQVFYLMNRIGSLNDIARKVRHLVPNARVGIIHGQMDRDDIEDVLNLFLDKEYNVLVCTTIIETGIDIPNANTIIIDRADALGLAQIYQIRGRVGRSDRLAYAYLMYEPNRLLTETGKKRLETIKEYTDLGSGYKIAMRDLAIRGAGDILGSEQSGFIDDIGIDLYLKLLNEAVAKEQGILKEVTLNTNIGTINVSRHIDESYILDDSLRISMHQEINRIKSKKAKENLEKEFTDRYGTLDISMFNYIESKYLEFLLKSKGIEMYKENGFEVDFNFDSNKTKKIMLQDLEKNWPTKVKRSIFSYKHNRIFIHIDTRDYQIPNNKYQYLYILTSFLEKF